MKPHKKIASNRVILEDGTVLSLRVLEIIDGKVTRMYPLSQELPATEWLSGQIYIKSDSEGNFRAFYNNMIIE